MNARDFIASLVDGAMDDETVSVKARWLRALLSDPAPTAKVPESDTLTVEDLGKRYGRSPATARAWCAEGRFPNAWRLGRQWRVPVSDLAALAHHIRKAS